MNRREFVRTAGIVAAGVSLAGCPGSGGAGDDEPSVIEGGQADVSTTVIRDAPQTQLPFEDSVEPVVPATENVLTLSNLVFQRAGPRGIVVSGEATNTGDRDLEAAVVDVSLYNTGEVEDGIIGSATRTTERVGLDAGATWQWSTTFSETPTEIDYFSVKAIGNYD